MESRLTFDTSRGPSAAALSIPPAATGVLVLAHGAGAGMDSPFIAGLARALNEAGVGTMRFDFPYMHAGRRAPDPAPALAETWRIVFGEAGERTDLPLFAGGKSMGGRIASVAVADGMPAQGLVFLGYPLHPPGKPERLRAEHLDLVRVPMLFVQGTRDSFARPDLLAGVLGRLGEVARLVPVEGGDHSFRVQGGERDQAMIGAALAGAVSEFVADVAGG